jgi:Xaa-Pro aminopeptidase
MYKHFSTEFFVGNRARLRELFVGTAPIVITSNGVMQRNGDNVYAFRQDSSFWYLTGVNQADVILVMDKNKEYLILPEQQSYYDIFHGGYDQAELSKISGITTVLNYNDGWKQLEGRLKRVKHIATLGAGPIYAKELGFYTNPARRRLIKRLKAANPAAELLDLRSQLAIMRMVKQPSELAALQEAIDITQKGLKYVQKRVYQYEYEIEAALTNVFRKSGARGHAFSPIVSAGVRACALHQEENSGEIGSKDLLTLDVGAEVDNYAADISRTYSQGKNPSKRQRAVHAAVEAVQEYAFGLVKPGATIRENEKLVEQFMGEKLRELGLIKTIDRETVRKYFPHATSHYLGLDVHDAGDYDRPLEPGVVLTVEPGIYIPDEQIGVRIEDDVLVTEDGHEVLTRNLPRNIS